MGGKKKHRGYWRGRCTLTRNYFHDLNLGQVRNSTMKDEGKNLKESPLPLHELPIGWLNPWFWRKVQSIYGNKLILFTTTYESSSHLITLRMAFALLTLQMYVHLLLVRSGTFKPYYKGRWCSKSGEDTRKLSVRWGSWEIHAEPHWVCVWGKDRYMMR